jgi:NTP pyrophosphatase (non-canonical NTP hydrolase)
MSDKTYPLTFESMALINRERSLEWHPTGLDEWSVTDWSNAMAGEAGETCNATKKLKRIDSGITQSANLSRDQALENIRREIGDTLLYLDLLAQRIGAKLEDCVVEAFNEVSAREGFKQRLPGGRPRTCSYPGCDYPYLKSPPCMICYEQATGQ